MPVPGETVVIRRSVKPVSQHYLYKRISLFPLKRGNSAVKIDGGGGQKAYLYNVMNVKIGNFPGILMSSLKPATLYFSYYYIYPKISA